MALPARTVGQEILAYQSFEQGVNDNWGFIAYPPPYNTEGDSIVNGDEDIWDRIISFTNDIDQAYSGSWFWGMQDLNNSSGGGDFPHALAFDPINTSGYEDLTIKLAINCREWDTGDELGIVLCLDGVPQPEMIIFLGQGDTSTTGWEQIEVPVPGNIESVGLEIRAIQNGSSDYGGVDAVSLVGYASEPCAIEIITAEPICEDISDIGLDLNFSIQEKGPSNQYFVKLNNACYGPFDYLAGADQYRYIPDVASQPGLFELLVFDSDAPPANALRINEVLYDVPSGTAGDVNQDGVTSPSEDEFVEIVNFTGISFNLSGWSLWDNSGSQARHIFPEGTILGHREAIVIFGGGSPPAQMNNSLVQSASSGGLSLNNVASGGDQISLYEDTGGTMLHTYCDWSSGFSDADESINLNPDISGSGYMYHSLISTDNLQYSPGIGVNGYTWQWPASCVDAVFVEIPDCCQSHNFFRTSQSGSWDDVSIWEVSMDGLSDWKPACVFPGVSSDQIIHISSGTEVMLSDSAIIGDLTIASGGVMSLGQGVILLQNVSQGPELMVEGELHDHTNSQNGIKFIGNSTWELAPEGTFIKTGNSTGIGLRDQYHNGIVNIPASSNWIYRYEGGTTTPSIISVDMVYPNLTFENTAGGQYEPGIGNGYFQGGSGGVRVKGDLVIGGSSGGSYIVRNCNFSSDPLSVEGNLIIGASSILTNEKPPCCPNLVSIKEGTGYRFEGDIQISENALLELRKRDDGDSNENTNERVCWISGSEDQQLSGPGLVDIDHLGMITAGSNLIVSRDLTIRKKLELIDGKIDMSGHTLFVLSNNPSSVEGHSPGESEGPSYIFNGTLDRGVQPTGLYDYPLGNTLNYQLLSLELVSSNVEHISARFFNNNGNYQPITEDGYGYSDLLNNGHWSIAPSTGQPTFEGVYNITLYGRGYSNPGTPCAALKTENGDWQNNPSGSSSPTDCTIGPGYIKAIRNDATSFSRQGIGINGVLPLSDLSLIAAFRESGNVYLEAVWHGDVMDVGMHFRLYREEVGTMPTLIHTSKLELASIVNKTETIDHPSAPGFIIYRVELVSASGEILESTMASIFIPESSSCTLFPTPARDFLTIECGPAHKHTLHVYNSVGKKYSIKRLNGNSYDISHLNPGLYWVEFNANGMKFLKL